MLPERRIGLLGAGALGAVHAANLTRIPGCRLQLVAASELSPTVVGLADRAGAEVVDPSALLDPARIDVVIIATPTDTHAVLAGRAAELGLPVFLEKPATRTLAEAEALVAVAASTGARVAVGHVVRYFPEYAAAREMVVGGGLGVVQTARLRRLNSGPARSSSWYADPGRSGGVLLDMAIHDIDWVLWAFGPVGRVYGQRSGDDEHQVASVTLRHRSGVISYLDSSWREQAFSTELEVTGTEGMYRTTGSADAGFRATRRRSTPASYLPPSADQPVPDDPYLLELRAALDWFAGGPAPLATLGDAVEALRVVEAAELSIATGTPVDLVRAAA